MFRKALIVPQRLHSRRLALLHVVVLALVFMAVASTKAVFVAEAGAEDLVPL